MTFLWAICVSGLDSLNGSRLAPFRRVSKQSERLMPLNSGDDRGLLKGKKMKRGEKRQRQLLSGRVHADINPADSFSM